MTCKKKLKFKSGVGWTLIEHWLGTGHNLGTSWARVNEPTIIIFQFIKGKGNGERKEINSPYMVIDGHRLVIGRS